MPSEFGRLDGERLERSQGMFVDFGFHGEVQRRRIADKGNTDARFAGLGQPPGTLQEQFDLTGKFGHKAVTGEHASA
jgi:hypothetical protein